MYPGQYWIDPNGGDMNDAILVHCDMKTGSSCIYPKPMQSPDIQYKGTEHEAWLSEMEEGFTVGRYLLLRQDLQSFIWRHRDQVAQKYWSTLQHTWFNSIKLVTGPIQTKIEDWDWWYVMREVNLHQWDKKWWWWWNWSMWYTDIALWMLHYFLNMEQSLNCY